MSKIIISYRRLDSLDITMRIRDVMATHFGENSVFTDIDSIPFGVDFLDHITSEVSTSDALIAIVGPRWTDGGGGPGQGVHLETDFVRIEVEAALKRKIPIIPVFVGGARMPSRDELPDALRPFVLRNGTSIDSGVNFRNDVNRLIRSLDATLPHNKNPKTREESKKARGTATSTARVNENTETKVSSLTQDEPYSVEFIRSLLFFNSETIKNLRTCVGNIAIYLRGLLLPNVFFSLPWLLVLAAITIFVWPDSESLHISRSGTTLSEDPQGFNAADHFGATLIALCLFGFFWLIYYFWRSMKISGPAAEKIEVKWIQVGAVLYIMVVVIAFFEMQPIVLDAMFKSANRQGGILATYANLVNILAVLLIPLLAWVPLFSSYTGQLLKRADKERGFRVMVLRAANRAAARVADVGIPLLLWVAYLNLAFTGIKDLDPNYVNWSASYYHVPLWVVDVSQRLFGYKAPVAWFYLGVGSIILVYLCLPRLVSRLFGGQAVSGEHQPPISFRRQHRNGDLREMLRALTLYP